MKIDKINLHGVWAISKREKDDQGRERPNEWKMNVADEPASDEMVEGDKDDDALEEDESRSQGSLPNDGTFLTPFIALISRRGSINNFRR
jgi:hypothetical protein